MSYDIVREEVPPFVKRVGDQVFQGSNNSLIVLGTDRAAFGPASIHDGLGTVSSPGGGKGAGTIHLVVGRKDPKGDPDFRKDDSFLYVSQRTNVDENLGASLQEGDSNGLAAIVAKSDAVRVVYRENLRLLISDGKNYVHMDDGKVVIRVGSSFMQMEDGKITIDSGTIELGKGAQERVVLGDSFMLLHNTHVHPTPVGPTGVPIVQMTDAQLSSRRTLVR